MSFTTPTHKNVSSFSQYGTVTGALGASGSVVATIPVGYSSATSYNLQVTHSDSTAGIVPAVITAVP